MGWTIVYNRRSTGRKGASRANWSRARHDDLVTATPPEESVTTPPALPAPRRKPVTSPAMPAHTAPPAVVTSTVRGRIEAPSLVHLAAESIRDMILSGRLAPGERLIEERLTEE